MRKDEMGLDQQARIQWMTPNSRDWKSEEGGAAIVEQMKDHAPNLSKQVIYSHPDPQTETDGPGSLPTVPISRQRLNSAFVCGLMAWPWFWTQPEPISFAREETELFLSRARSHLRYLCGERP
jgi:hypothetical protein